MTNPARYLVYCITESVDVLSNYVYSAPTTCPHDNGHTIDPALTRIQSVMSINTLFSFSFASSTSRYLQLSGGPVVPIRTRICQFDYPGTNNTSEIVKITAILSNGSGTGCTGILDLRPWNEGLTGSYGTGTIFLAPNASLTPAYITEFSGLPSDPTTLEFGISIIGDTSCMRIHSLIVSQKNQE